MGIYRSNKRRYQAREAAKKSLEKRYHNKVLEQVTSQLAVIYQEQLVAVHQILSELPNNGSTLYLQQNYEGGIPVKGSSSQQEPITSEDDLTGVYNL
ncbi:14601_t:CDS:2, partial [Gigaspora rosea]